MWGTGGEMWLIFDVTVDANICARKTNHTRKNHSSHIVLAQIPPGLKIG